MILKFVPPLILSHRCFLERGEKAIAFEKLTRLFGQGGDSRTVTPVTDRWCHGHMGIQRLQQLKIADVCYGEYYGFRNADDALLFFMKYQGLLKK